MNSSEGFTFNGRVEESSSSNELTSSDSNANLNSSHPSKGAIPKNRTLKQSSTSKKPIKLNNNEEMLIPIHGTNTTETVYQLHSDMLRINGYSESSRLSGNYLDDYKTVLFRSNSGNCENLGIKNTITPHIDDNDHVDVNRFLDQPPVLYQPSCSSKDIDLSMLIKVDTESNSSEENELLSISDDGCIYTYKGDNAADLPSSFFSLDVPLARSPEVSLTRQDNVSPEMDFLEMDFDPGPSGDADSDSQSNADMENTENLPQDVSFNEVKDVNDLKHCEDKRFATTALPKMNVPETITPTWIVVEQEKMQSVPESNTSTPSTYSDSSNNKKETFNVSSSITERIRKIRMPWSCTLNQRSVASSVALCSSRRLHCSLGEFTLPTEKLSSPIDDTSYCVSIKNSNSENEKIETMIWSEEEASKIQITQIGASACGATAVLNVLNALRFPLPSIEKVREAVKTRLRLNGSSLTEYLLSRSVAGSTHQDLINGLNQLSEGEIYARFFHLYPERLVNLNVWLQFWISQGAVPIATLNLQKCEGIIPDAWHHQMIFGVGNREVYLTNPLECVDVGQLWPQLTSESILLIRKDDVLSRWNMKTDLRQLMRISDERWCKLNVVGQVANMVRESRREARPGFASTTHLKIPAAYSAGITLAIRKDAPLCPLLMFCPELPLLPTKDEAVGYSDIH